MMQASLVPHQLQWQNLITNSMQDRIKELYKKIKEYDTAYYGNNVSQVSDQEYDSAYRELKDLELKFPNLKEPNSPTDRVGDDLTDVFEKVEHSTPMMSIDNTYSHEELSEWLEKTRKTLEVEDLEFVCELKMDGVACSVNYKNGLYTRAATRGNGTIGDNITANVKTIRSIPLKVDLKEDFELRGEIYMRFDRFNSLNEELQREGLAPMQNPRNTAAGTVKLQDPKIVSSRGLSFRAHNVLKNSSGNSHIEDLQNIANLGIPVVPHSKPLTSTEEIIKYIEEWDHRKSSNDFPIDGIVIKVNRKDYREILGNTAKSPRWVISYKYKPDTAETIVNQIDVQVGRTGVITPVARLTPVFISGSTVSNATLHNYDEIKRLDIRVGDLVEIEKSGEIIPKILRVVKSYGGESPQMPTTCPSCGSETNKREDEVALRCLNSLCPARTFASLTHFVSRNAMNIDGFGPAVIDQLLKLEQVKNPADLYKLTHEMLSSLDRMGEKSADNIINAINKSKENPLHSLIAALGIPMVGSQSAKLLAANIEDISDLYTISIENLSEIDSIGPVMAESIKQFFDNPYTKEIIESLKLSGVNTKGTKGEAGSEDLPLKGEVVVLTGSLEKYKRKELQNILEDRGAKVTSSVSKKTTLVIAGKEAGSKLAKAEKLDIKILEESQLDSII